MGGGGQGGSSPLTFKLPPEIFKANLIITVLVKIGIHFAEKYIVMVSSSGGTSPKETN